MWENMVTVLGAAAASAPAAAPAAAPGRMTKNRPVPAGGTPNPDGVSIALTGGGTVTAATGTVVRNGQRMPAISMRYVGPRRRDVHFLQFVEQWLERSDTGNPSPIELTGPFPAVIQLNGVPTRIREKEMRLSDTRDGASSNVDTKLGQSMYYDEAFGAKRPFLTRRVETIDAPYTDPALIPILGQAFPDIVSVSSFRGFATYVMRKNRPELLVWWELSEQITPGKNTPTLTIRWAAPVTTLQPEDRAALDREYPANTVPRR
ncbi:MAG TPA: hypothetical protein VFC00_09415 [Micromonosporaceae bacterium]|nr:hypothetical protein [Micromonosporaceae bacterium]